MRFLVGLLIVLSPTLAGAKVFDTGKGGTVDCATDGSSTINTNEGTFTFKGTCKSIIVNGNKNVVTIESVGTLSVNGNENTTNAGSVDLIAASGNNNKVTYKKGAKIANTGNGNKIAQGDGGGGGKPADKPADKPAPTGGGVAVDCGKSPKYVINDGAGTYTFSGKCDEISVSGGENKLTIESVKKLAIAGAENTVDVDAADTIAAIGNDNKVTWKKGVSGAKPKVSSVGSGNKITQVK